MAGHGQGLHYGSNVLIRISSRLQTLEKDIGGEMRGTACTTSPWRSFD
jgi:hypothetical protein